MKCAVCGGELRTAATSLPFKVSDATIVNLKDLPIVQCTRCPENLIEDEVLRRMDEILAKVEGGTQLEVVRYTV